MFPFSMYCYHVTSKGRRIMGALIELYHKDYSKLIAKAA